MSSTALAASADLAVSIDDGQDIVAQGSVLTYALLVTNLGPDDAVGAAVSSQPDSDLLNVSWTCLASSGSTCPASGTGSLSASVDLIANGSATFTFEATVDADAAGTLNHSASVLNPAGAGDPNPANNSDSDSTALTGLVDLAVELSSDQVNAIPGEAAGYRLEVRNEGPDNATDAQLSLDLPDDGVCAWQCTATGGATCGNGASNQSGQGDLLVVVALPRAARLTFAVDCQVPSSRLTPWSLQAEVQAAPDTTDTQLQNNVDQLSTPMAPVADVSIQVSDGRTSAVPGADTTNYTVTVGNLGPSDAQSVVVVSDFPQALGDLPWTCLPAGAALCSPSGIGDILDTVTLPAGTSITYFADATLPSDLQGTLLHQATVTPPSTVEDPDENNNQASDLTGLTPRADLTVSKTDGLTNASPGTATQYTLSVQNLGPSDAPQSIVRDILPEAVSCTWTCLPDVGAQCTASGSGGLFEIVDLPASRGATFTLSCLIDPDAAESTPDGVLSNTATVEVANGVTELQPANNTATDLTLLDAEADLRIIIDDGVTEAVPGTSVTYTVEVQNLGPADVDAVQVDGAQASGGNDLDCLWTCVGSGGGSCTPGQVLGNLNDIAQLPVNAMARYSVSCEVDPAATGVLSYNVSTMADGVTDPFPADNQASDTNTQLKPQVDLRLTKDDGVTTASPGDTLTYQVTVSNEGPSQAVDAQVSDVFPGAIASVDWTCAAQPGAQCGQASGTGDLAQTIQLGPGSSLHYTAVALLRSDAAGSVVNQAEVSPGPGQAETQPADNVDSDVTALEAETDLSVQLDDGLTSAVPGEPIAYLLTVHNAGPADVNGASVLAQLDRITGVLWTCTADEGASCPASGGDELHTVVDLAADSSVVFSIEATVESSATGTLNPSASVMVPGGVTDPQNADNHDADIDTVLNPEVDLSVQLEDGVDFAVPGLDVTYTLAMANSGPSDAPGSRVVAPLPEGLQCTWDCLEGGSIPCPTDLPTTGALLQLLDLPAMSQLQLQAQCSVQAALTGTLEMTAQVSASESAQEIEPRNNQAVDSNLLTPRADVVITKTDDQNVATPGDTLTYTLRVRNQAGPSHAADVTVQDVFPNTLACFWSCQGQGGAACGQGQNTGPLLDLAQLPVGGEAVYTAQCTVDEDASGEIVNSATATPPSGLEDLNPSNNSALDTTQLRPRVDVAVTVTDGVTEAVPGTSVTYTVSVQHLSGPDIDDVLVRDTFPGELSCLWTCEGIGGGVCTPGQVAGDIVDTVDLPIGAQARYTAVCDVAPDATGFLSNTATVEVPADAHDPQDANNTSSDLDTELTPRVDVAISMTDDATSVVPGGEVVYDIAVNNTGPSSVAGVQVEDVFSADLDCTWTCATFEGASCTAGPIEGNLVDLVDLPAGSAVHYAATCDVLAAAGSVLSNTAAVHVPVGVEDTNAFNDQATDDDTRVEVITDLSLQLDNNQVTVVPGTEVIYSLVVERSADALALRPANVPGNNGLETIPGYGLWRWTPGEDNVESSRPELLGYIAAPSCEGLARQDGSLGAWCLEDSTVERTWHPLRSQDIESLTALPEHLTPPAAAVSVDLTVQSTVPNTLDCTWTCAATPGSLCNIGPSAGSLNDAVRLEAGGLLSYEARCNVDSAATGDLGLTAHLVVPAGIVDPTSDDLQDVDADALTPQADIQVSKSDGLTQAAPGDAVTYTIDVFNGGPSDAPEVAVSDVFAAELDCLWSCQADGGDSQANSDCAPGQASGDLLDLASLPAGSGVTYSAVCHIAADAVGVLANTAQAQPQGDVEEVDSSNNAASDLDTVLVPRGDVQVSLTDGVQQAVPGGTVHYVLHVLNAGPSLLSGVEVIDLFPETLDCLWTCSPEAGASCASGQTSGDLLDIVELPTSASVTYDAVCQIDDGATGTLINEATASVPSGSQDPNLGNNLARDEDTLLEPVADLSITMDNGVTQVAPGDAVTYSIAVHNDGPSTDGAALVQSHFDSTLTCLWSCQPSPGAQCTVGPVAGDLVDTVFLPSGGSVAYTAECDVSADASGELLHNVSVIPGIGVADPNSNNNTAADLDELLPLADVQLTKTDGVTVAVPGTSVTYTLTASNAGPSPAQDVELRDQTSGLLDCTWTCTSTGLADCGSNIGTDGNLLALLQLPVGGVATWAGECAIASSATGVLSNTAQLALPDGVLDLNPSNNVASDADTELVPSADLSISKDDGIDEALAGDTITYTMVARNLGPSDAPDITVQDAFPNMLACSWSCEADPGAQCAADPRDGELLDTASLPAGAQITYTAICDIAAEATGSVTNTVTIAADGVTDPEDSNNSASDTDLLVDTADLSIQVVGAPDPVQVGGTLFYGLVITNQGPAAEAAPRVDILLPSLVDLLSVVLGGPETIFIDGFEGGDTDAWNGGTSTGGGLPGLCELSNNTLTCQLNVLAADDVQELTLTVLVDGDAEDVLVLTATVQGEGNDPDSTNNVASELTSVD